MVGVFDTPGGGCFWLVGGGVVGVVGCGVGWFWGVFDTPLVVCVCKGFGVVGVGWVCVLVGVRVSYSSCCRLVSFWTGSGGVRRPCVVV